MIILDGKSLTLNQLIQISRYHETVAMDPDQMELVKKASLFVKQKSESDEPIYGINTGFGHLAHVKIDKKEVNQLQENLLMSHACGVGEPLPIETVRAMMVLRINALIQGYSGIRLETLHKMVEYLNDNFIPVVFEKGSLGASGDLALLSHMSLPLIGKGEVFWNGVRMSTEEALKASGKNQLIT
jgi:histidine ammonia-lyase